MAADEGSDAALVVLAQRGDLGALSSLFQRHRALLYASAIGVLRDRAEAADAVQDTFVTALTRISTVRDPAAIDGWLRTVLLNTCRMRLRTRRPTPVEHLPDIPDPHLDPEYLMEKSELRDWVWSCLAEIGDEERLTLILRHFSRCASYRDIASVTAVPIGTVRSRLHRAHSLMAAALTQETGTSWDQQRLESECRAAWEHFYDAVLEAPESRTYRPMFAPDVHVRDSSGTWTGIEDWVAEERPAIEVGVRATVVAVTAAPKMTVLEIDFTNPPDAPEHCPPRSTFVHRLEHGRTKQLAIHYLAP